MERISFITRHSDCRSMEKNWQTPREEFSIAATGDIHLSRSIKPWFEHERFEPIVSELQSSDTVVSNVERTIIRREDIPYTTTPRPISDTYQYQSSPGYRAGHEEPDLLDDLVEMGVDFISCANNQSFNFGIEGIIKTMEELRKKDITYAGIGYNLPDARRPRYKMTPGGRVGFIHSTTSFQAGSEAGEPSSLVPGRPGINPLNVEWTYRASEDDLAQLRDIARRVGIEDVKDTWLSREGANRIDEDNFAFMQMVFESVEREEDAGIKLSLYDEDKEAILNQIREADDLADYVVKTIHTHQGPNGQRNAAETPDFFVEFAHDCIDAGADVIIGTGPHRLQGIEIYDGKPIFYSLGHFIHYGFTLDLAPADTFKWTGVEDDTRPSLTRDISSKLSTHADDSFYTVVPTCKFKSGELDRVELIPCKWLSYLDHPKPQVGTPLLATDDDIDHIFDLLQNRSERFGTNIETDGPKGIITVD